MKSIYYIFGLFIWITFGCNSKPNTEHSKIPISPKVLAYVDSYIDMDSVEGYNDKVYKLTFSRRFDHTLVRIMPITAQSQIFKDLPFYSFKRGGKIILVYNGLEAVGEIDSSLILEVNRELKNDITEAPQIPGASFDPIIWEIFLNQDTVYLNKRPSNPYDIQLQAPKFTPPVQE